MAEFERDKIQLPIIIVDNSIDESEFARLEKFAENSRSAGLNLYLLKNSSNVEYYYGNYTGIEYLVSNFDTTKVLTINPDGPRPRMLNWMDEPTNKKEREPCQNCIEHQSIRNWHSSQ